MSEIADNGRPVGSAKHGVYIFYDYDGEPIYTGQTYEGLRSRVGRHLTGHRSDAVAKSVLDPFEVAEIEMWPLWDLKELPTRDAKPILNQAEFTVYQQAIANSRFGAILNEGDVQETDLVPLPRSYRSRIIPDGIYERRKHADIRIARRAQTIASLARGISERNVRSGVRRTLLTQAQRLEWLARERYLDAGGADDADDESDD